MKQKQENRLPAEIAALAETFSASFTCVVYDGDACLSSGAYGFADRETGRQMTLSDTFALSLHAPWLLSLALLRLVEQNKLKLGQKLSEFYPQLPYADKISLLMLVRGRAGIPDYVTSVIRKGYDADPAYRALPERERLLHERQDAAVFADADAVLELVRALPPEFEPDTKGDGQNRSCAALLAGVLEKATGLPLFALCKALVFDPAGMTVLEGDVASTACQGATQDGTRFPLPRPQGFCIPLTYTTDTASFVKLGLLIRNGGLLSAPMWKRIVRYARTEGPLGMDDVDGCLVLYDGAVLGNSLRLFSSPERGVMACYLMNEYQTACRIDGKNEYLCPCIRYAWEGAVQKLTAPRMVKLTRRNIWNALDLRVTPTQENYVLDAPRSIANCAVTRTWKPYLLEDGNRAIGLLVLEIDKKKDVYEVGIVLIDRRYQGRGYGMFMLTFAVDALREAGAKRLSIGVNRENEAARRLYESLGFRPHNVYEGGLELVKELP